MQYDDRKALPMTYALGYLIGWKYKENFDETITKISMNILSDSCFGLHAKETAVMMLRCTTEQRYVAVLNFQRMALGIKPTEKDYAVLGGSTKKLGKKKR